MIEIQNISPVIHQQPYYRPLRSREALRSLLARRPDRSALLLRRSLALSTRSSWRRGGLRLRLRLGRCARREEERLRLLFLRGDDDLEEVREDGEEEDEEEEDEERLLVRLELLWELLLRPLAGDLPPPPRPERSFPLWPCGRASLPSLSLRDLRLSPEDSASLASCLCKTSD